MTRQKIDFKVLILHPGALPHSHV